MSSITIEASKVARKSPIRVDTSLVGTVSGVEDVTVSLPSTKARLRVGKWGYKSNTITVEDGQTVAPLFLYFIGGRYLPLIAVLSTIILLFSLPFLKLEIVD